MYYCFNLVAYEIISIHIYIYIYIYISLISCFSPSQNMDTYIIKLIFYTCEYIFIITFPDHTKYKLNLARPGDHMISSDVNPQPADTSPLCGGFQTLACTSVPS